MLIRIAAAVLFAFTMASAIARAQTSPDIQNVLERLDKLEAENARLRDEIRALRAELTTPATEERLDVQENRTAELEQTKVAASQRFPVTLTGMLLFNAFKNGQNAGAAQVPAAAALNKAPAPDGASLRQTVLGLKFNGPDLPGGGKASGSLYMDFFAGTNVPANNLLRIRIATLDLAWKNTTISVGQDKPLISPREPVSLAQVGISPLTAAGNLWNWNPQFRLEQRFAVNEHSGLKAQGQIYETTENYSSTLPPQFAATLQRSRPSYEGRFELFQEHGGRRVELAPGFHIGATHVAGHSVQSRIASFDWLVRPFAGLEFSGELFRGSDVAGLGALPGFNVSAAGIATPVHSHGEWGQLAYAPTARLSFHAYSGQQANRVADLPSSGVIRNFVFAGNIMYKFAPNVIAAFEASQARTEYLGFGLRRNNHYDLALAYLF